MSHFLELKLSQGARYQVSRTVLYLQFLFVLLPLMMIPVILVEPTQLSAKDPSGMMRIEAKKRC